jgi:hypothetical protein
MLASPRHCYIPPTAGAVPIKAERGWYHSAGAVSILNHAPVPSEREGSGRPLGSVSWLVFPQKDP